MVNALIIANNNSHYSNTENTLIAEFYKWIWYFLYGIGDYCVICQKHRHLLISYKFLHF